MSNQLQRTETCRVCGDPVEMQIMRGTGLCCGTCEKIDKREIVDEAQIAAWRARRRK